MYFDMTFKDFSYLKWLSRNNSISGCTSFKTNTTMFTLVLADNSFEKSMSNYELRTM